MYSETGEVSFTWHFQVCVIVDVSEKPRNMLISYDVSERGVGGTKIDRRKTEYDDSVL